MPRGATILSLIPSRKPCLTFGHRLGIMGVLSASNRRRGQNPAGVVADSIIPVPKVSWDQCLQYPTNPTTRRSVTAIVVGRPPFVPWPETEWNDKGTSKTGLLRPETRCHTLRICAFLGCSRRGSRTFEFATGSPQPQRAQSERMSLRTNAETQRLNIGRLNGGVMSFVLGLS